MHELFWTEFVTFIHVWRGVTVLRTVLFRRFFTEACHSHADADFTLAVVQSTGAQTPAK